MQLICQAASVQKLLHLYELLKRFLILNLCVLQTAITGFNLVKSFSYAAHTHTHTHARSHPGLVIMCEKNRDKINVCVTVTCPPTYIIKAVVPAVI